MLHVDTKLPRAEQPAHLVANRETGELATDGRLFNRRAAVGARRASPVDCHARTRSQRPGWFGKVPRSNAKVTSITAQPPSTSPMRAESGTWTSL